MRESWEKDGRRICLSGQREGKRFWRAQSRAAVPCSFAEFAEIMERRKSGIVQININVFSEEEGNWSTSGPWKSEETGVWVKSDRAFHLLKDAGAKTNDEKKIVYFTEEMVRKAIDAALSALSCPDAIGVQP